MTDERKPTMQQVKAEMRRIALAAQHHEKADAVRTESPAAPSMKARSRDGS